MQAGATSIYYDEEECLGFDVFVAELELIVGLKKDSRPDGVQLLELLQKLIPSIERASKPVLKQYQRRCESSLFDVLLKGICSAVRKLIYICLFKLYTLGDLLPMYSRVSSLQAFLGSKDGTAKTTPEAIRVGVLDCLAYLALHQGRFLASGALESISIAHKTAGKSTEAPVRAAALRLAAAVVEGLGSGDRSATTVQAEAWKVFERNAKDKSSEEARAAALGVVAGICRAGGIVLWGSGGWYFEEAVKTCVLCLDDTSQGVREGAAAALGELAACGRHTTAAEALAAEKRVSKKVALEKVVSGTMQAALVQPLCDAAVYSKRDVCSALAQAWVAYLAALQSRYTLTGEGLVDCAVEVVNALEVAARCFAEARERGLLPPDQGLGSCLSGGEMPHAQACAIYVLRVGIVERLSEAHQRKLLDQLTSLAQSAIVTPVAVVALEGIGLLLEVLGEVPEEVGHAAEAAIRSKMAADCVAVRSQAAAALAALAAAQPPLAAQLLSACLESLEAAAGRLTRCTSAPPSPTKAAAVPPVRELSMLPGTPRATSDMQVKDIMNAVHGTALASAALLIATARLPLGVPSNLPVQAYNLSRRCIMEPAQDATPRAVHREAGYVLLGALLVSMHPDALRERQAEVVELLLVALGEPAREELDEKLYTRPGSEADLAVAMWWRAAALQALSAYLLGTVARGLAPSSGHLRQLASALSPMLQAITLQPFLHDSSRAKGGTAGWPAAAAAMLQLRLLEVYYILPGAHTFSTDHAAIIKLCVRPLRATSGAVASPESAAIIGKSSLRQMLNSQDAILGPWLPGRDLYQDELQAFVGDRGGPQQHPWEAGMAFTSGQLGADAQDAGGLCSDAGGLAAAVRAVRRFMPYPQPYSLLGSLLEVQLWLLGKMFAVVTPINQLQILEVMVAASQLGKGLKRIERDAAGRRQATCICVAAAALSGLAPMAKRGTRSGNDSAEKVAEKVLAVAWALLEEHSGDPALTRVVAEVVAAAGCIGGDAFLLGLVRSLCADIKESVAQGKDPERRAVMSLALGCIHRQAGGMALQSVVPTTTEHLVLVASRPTGTTHLWALHALLQVANAAGPAFMPFVRSTLQLAQELLVSTFESPQLRAAAARLANAMVAVLGPELDLGSPLYQKCKSLTTPLEIGVGEGDALARGGVEATWAELENVLFAQQLILFSPHAVPPAKHIPLLQATLASRRPALRRAAAATLRHLAERDAAAVLQECIEEALFAALDGEIDSRIAGQLKGALEALLAAGAARAPSRWVRVLGDVALAAGSPAGPAAADLSSSERGDVADDDDEGAPPPAPSPAASPPGKARPAAGTATPRLRTRQLAAACLLKLFRVVVEDPRHADPAVLGPGHADDDREADLLLLGDPSSGKPDGDWLIQHLQQLIDLGFKLATGQTEALKPAGVRLLDAVVRTFGAVPDPLQPGALLLEQYQAQLVSALRSALQPGAPPPLAIAGGSLATTFLESGLAAGDATVMRRLMGLLTAPLAAWAGLRYTAYAEWVGVRARVALLQAHAQCATLALRAPAEDLCASTVASFQAPYMDMLVVMWGSLLQDHAVLATQTPAVLAQYRSPLYGSSTPLVVAAVRPCYAAACPVVLEALTASLPPAPVIAESRQAAALSAGSNGLADGLGVHLVRTSTRSSADEWNEFTETITAAVSAAANGASADGSGRRQGAAGGQAAGGERLQEKAWEMYRVLLDVALMVVADNAAQLAQLLQGPSEDEDVAALVAKLASSLKGLGAASSGAYLAAHLPPPEICGDVLRAATALTVQVLAPMLVHVHKSGRPYTPHIATLGAALATILKDFTTAVPEQYYSAQADLPQAAVEACLACSSILVPYHFRDHSQQRTSSPPPFMTGTGGLARQSSLLPQYVSVAPRASSGSGQDAATMEQALVPLLVACQALLKKVPLSALEATAAALLECGLRLLSTAASGVPLTASQRFLDGCISLLLERSKGSGAAAIASELAASTALSVCEITRDAQLRLFPGAAGPDEMVSTPTRVLTTGGSFRSAAEAHADPAARLPTLLAATLSAASQLPADCSAGAVVQQQVVANLRQALSADAPSALYSKVTAALLAHLQDIATTHPSRLPWAQRLTAALLPHAALLAHTLLSAPASPAPLPPADISSVADTLKTLLLAATTICAPLGERAQAAPLRSLVPLLIEAAAPPSTPTPPLTDLALKFVTALPASAAAGPFRAVLTDQPLQLKQRLQQAVQQQAAAAAAAAQASTRAGARPASQAPGGLKPSIQLKTTFAIPS